MPWKSVLLKKNNDYFLYENKNILTLYRIQNMNKMTNPLTYDSHS